MIPAEGYGALPAAPLNGTYVRVTAMNICGPQVSGTDVGYVLANAALLATIQSTGSQALGDTFLAAGKSLVIGHTAGNGILALERVTVTRAEVPEPATFALLALAHRQWPSGGDAVPASRPNSHRHPSDRTRSRRSVGATALLVPNPSGSLPRRPAVPSESDPIGSMDGGFLAEDFQYDRGVDRFGQIRCAEVLGV